MLAVRLDDETERRLEALAERTGRTKTFYARAAIEAHLDELEAFYLAEERVRSFADRDVIDREPARGELIGVFQRLWAQGEASGTPVEGNFDAADVARRGADRLAAARRDD